MSETASYARLSLRRRTILFGAIVVLSIIVVSSFLVNTIVRNSFTDLESSYVASDVQRAVAAVNEDTARLGALAADWSSWDETYAYLQGGNPGFAEANLSPQILAGLTLNLAIVADASGAIVFARNIDLDSLREMPLPDSPYFKSGSALLALSGTSGLLDVNGTPVIISAQPVLTTLGTGPALGTLVLGRTLDAAAMARLQDSLQLAFRIQEAAGAAPAPDNASVVQTAGGPAVTIAPLDQSTIAGYAAFHDVFGQPDLVLTLQLPRDIYTRGLRNAFILSASLAAFVAVCLLLMLWIFDRQVLKRVSRIDSFVRGLDFSTQQTPERIGVAGQDELSRLSVYINGMIDRIDQSQTSLRKTGQRYRALAQQLQGEYDKERELRQELQEETEKRIEFTRALVHELKTPITPVLAAIELLKEEALDDQATRLVRAIDRSAVNLNKRIDDLLDLARAEVGLIEIKAVPVDAATLLGEVADDFRAVLSASQVTLKTDFQADLPRVLADRSRFRQIAENLLTNAVKFSSSNSTVYLAAAREGGDLVVTIRDTGLGISAEDQEHLFDSYQRPTGDRERLSGLRLGLALSKTLVELQGGRIWVVSEKGKGSTFGFSLPLATGAGQVR